MGCYNSKIFIKDQNENIYNDMIWSSRDECCICLNNKSNILFLPCNHICICQDCINIKNFTNCPICQEAIYSTNFLRITPVI